MDLIFSSVCSFTNRLRPRNTDTAGFLNLREEYECVASVFSDNMTVACLDSRCNPYEVLGIKPYEGIVIRNIGGRFITNASDIAALDTLFRIHQIILLQHDNCGASHITTPQVLDAVRAKRPEFEAAGGRTSAELAARLPAKQDNYESLKEDLKTAKQCGFLREDLIDNMVGLWLDVNSGLVTRIYPDPESSP